MKNWVFVAFGATLFCGAIGESLVACDSSSPADPVNEGQPEGGPLGADTGVVDTGTTSSDASDDAGPVTFTEVYTTVIKPVCPSCHSGGASATGNLDMGTQALAYANLVGVKASGSACGSSGDTRVIPNDAKDSLIWEKLTETAPPCGSQMPLGRTPLPQSQTDLLAAWIDQGALDDTKPADAGSDGSADAGSD